MENFRKVSIWFGNFNHEKSFLDFIEIAYTEDGDAIPSQFEISFDIEYYDEDFMEVVYFDEKQNNYDKLLQNFSYSENIISHINKQCDNTYYNVVVLLYHFEYDGKIKQYMDCNDNQLYYIDCVDYIEE